MASVTTRLDATHVHRLAVLVRESLALWGVDARVDVPSAGSQSYGADVLRIDGPGARLVSIIAADPADDPIRWWLCWHVREAGTAGSAIMRRKPCASALGLLRTLRESLGIAAGPRVRIGLGAAPGPAA